MLEIKEMNNNEFNEEDLSSLNPWVCLATILSEYNIDCSHITNRMGMHIINDFMNSLVNTGDMINKKIEEIKKIKNE